MAKLNFLLIDETQDSDGFLAALNSVTDSRPIRHSSSNFSKPGLIQKAVENKKANTNDTNIEISNSNIKVNVIIS